MLPDKLKYNANETNKSKKDQNQISPSSINTALKQSESEQQRQNINNFVEEWESLKPAILRVVALEEDMKFLLATMQDIADVGPVYAANQPLIDFEEEQVQSFENAEPIEYDTAQVLPKNKFFNNRNVISNSIQDNTLIDDKFSSAAGEVVVLPAPRLLADDSSEMTGMVDVNQLSDQDDKFTYPSDYDVQSKMIEQPAKQLADIVGQVDCSLTNLDIGKGLAIHLVSYKSKNRLLSGSQKLSAQFSDVLCGKTPVFKEVIVDNTKFYSMRFGPYNNKTEAVRACSSIRQTGQYCGITQFDGTQIL